MGWQRISLCRDFLTSSHTLINDVLDIGIGALNMPLVRHIFWSASFLTVHSPFSRLCARGRPCSVTCRWLHTTQAFTLHSWAVFRCFQGLHRSLGPTRVVPSALRSRNRCKHSRQPRIITARAETPSAQLVSSGGSGSGSNGGSGAGGSGGNGGNGDDDDEEYLNYDQVRPPTAAIFPG